MSIGLVALLDDIAALAKAAAASVDDVAGAATKASSKAIGVVIDDTAVTPQYVQGLKPERELPVIKRIARGSLINKLGIILPVALLLTWLAPWSLPILLLVGGTYLCFEGAEKVLSAWGIIKEHEDSHGASDKSADPAAVEKAIVSSAVRTDLILSTEIMLVSLAGLHTNDNLSKVAIMVVVGFIMTFFVYGLVALLVKMDDLGLALVRRGQEKLGRAIVKTMPRVFRVIEVVGTVAMLWVGGHIVIDALNNLGVGTLHHLVEHAAHAATHTAQGLGDSLSGVVKWCVETACSGVFGLAFGALVTGLVLGLQRLLRQRAGQH